MSERLSAARLEQFRKDAQELTRELKLLSDLHNLDPRPGPSLFDYLFGHIDALEAEIIDRERALSEASEITYRLLAKADALLEGL